MTREEMMEGFARGRTLVQEEWATEHEIKCVDELIAQGYAQEISPWEYKDGFQCERRIIRGIRKEQV